MPTFAPDPKQPYARDSYHASALSTTLDAMADGVLIGDVHGIRRCNAAALSLLGAKLLDDLQISPDLWADRFRMRLQRSDPPLRGDRLPLQRALLGHTEIRDLWATRADTGSDVNLRCAARPIVVAGRIEGAVVVVSDLDERAQLRQKRYDLDRVQHVLGERDAQWRALVDGVRDYAIYTLDPAGRISSWHQGAQRMMGLSAEEAIGTHYARLFAAEERVSGRPGEEMVIAARLGEFKGEGRRMHKTGGAFDAAVVLTALRGPRGELLGFLKLMQNITGRLRQERERESLLVDAQAARAEAERASRTKGEFLATISHELRTPLSAVLGWAHVLQRGVVDPTTLERGLSAISRNARIQAQLIDDLLDMTRIEAGELRLDLQRVELQGMVTAAIDASMPAVLHKAIGVRTLFGSGGGVVHGDPARLRQIIGNLLNNAIKFTPKGGQISVSLTQDDRHAHIAVTDTGQGIAPEFVSRLFDRFEQQDASRTRRHGGLGLGLAMVRRLTHLHGGSVHAESAGEGHGATVTVTLPLHVSQSTQPTSCVASSPEEGPEARIDGLRVLLVDDEADMRSLIVQVLRDGGAEVLAVSSAQEGFDALDGSLPDVIVSDIGMPGTDGYDFIRRVRQRPAHQGGCIPALAFTAFSRPDDRDRALDAGFQRYLAKPATPHSLLQALLDLKPIVTT